jgi:hypothetical protein
MALSSELNFSVKQLPWLIIYPSPLDAIISTPANNITFGVFYNISCGLAIRMRRHAVASGLFFFYLLGQPH